MLTLYLISKHIHADRVNEELQFGIHALDALVMLWSHQPIQHKFSLIFYDI